ncbi:unnamed protein product [Camellia sinensis]
MKVVDDIRTLNKSVHFRPSCNFLNINELSSLWEKKIGYMLPRLTVTEDDLLAAAAENIIVSLHHSHTTFSSRVVKLIFQLMVQMKLK